MYFVYQKRIVWYYRYEADGREFVMFLDDRLRVEEEQDYLQRIETQPDRYTKDVYFGKTSVLRYADAHVQYGGS